MINRDGSGILDTPLSRSMTINNGGDMRRGLKRLAGLTAIACIGLAPASVAGTWKHLVIPNDGDVLTYSDDGKVTFYLGCGRGFALHVKYPGAAKKKGETDIAISTAKGRMTFNGEFEEPFDAKDPVPMNFATDFRQTHFGYQHSDPQVCLERNGTPRKCVCSTCWTRMDRSRYRREKAAISSPPSMRGNGTRG